MTILLVFFLASTALAATENLTVASCSVVSGPLTIANCTGLNTSDDDTDVAIPKGKVLGTAMSDTSFNGTVNTVTVTFRHSGESGIGGTVGITFYDGTNGTTFCSEGTSTSNVSSFATSEVISCTPAGGWTAAKLDDLQIRVKNNDSGGGQDLFLSYLIVEVDYTAFVCGNNTKEGLEECDGTDLDSQTCATQGFDEGTLVCAGDCTFDTSGCSGFVCGNDTIEGSEVCDGTDLDSQTCVLQGFESGTLACQVDCTAFDT
ncbi:hypothetical protein KKE06_05165, partial [Candidatus Micrarchaeota archaeon]|nr:hypothetical protein [Candidatus Micrarchaeota archaeon]